MEKRTFQNYIEKMDAVRYLDSERMLKLSRQMLAEAMRQLKMVGVRILGFVYRESDSNKKRYGYRYKYSKKYYKYYQEYTKKTGKK